MAKAPSGEGDETCDFAGRADFSVRGEATYRWAFSYFERQKIVDPPWAHAPAEWRSRIHTPKIMSLV